MDATCHLASGAMWYPHFSKFACFFNTTERDNFLIRSPFEVKRTPLESSRRALRFGASFAEIGGLQKFGQIAVQALWYHDVPYSQNVAINSTHLC